MPRKRLHLTGEMLPSSHIFDVWPRSVEKVLYLQEGNKNIFLSNFQLFIHKHKCPGASSRQRQKCSEKIPIGGYSWFKVHPQNSDTRYTHQNIVGGANLELYFWNGETKKNTQNLAIKYWINNFWPNLFDQNRVYFVRKCVRNIWPHLSAARCQNWGLDKSFLLFNFGCHRFCCQEF